MTERLILQAGYPAGQVLRFNIPPAMPSTTTGYSSAECLCPAGWGLYLLHRVSSGGGGHVTGTLAAHRWQGSNLFFDGAVNIGVAEGW